ncbi:galactose mutarotase-like domain-containing protein [Endogone sp. FLAS-F59071]|nr:galactose mutarotase-like domain-containing protein [Endogone sp. FLAS-F59071]|eukprot:RUS13377.1 galactose mutarotase-like domain-containing protein [Endogone sp. FLAS-F59071]
MSSTITCRALKTYLSPLRRLIPSLMLSNHDSKPAIKEEPLNGNLPRPPTSYTLTNSMRARLTTAFHANLTLSSAPTADLGPDVPNLSLTFDHQTPTRLRLLIRDAAAARWTVPRDVVSLDPDGPEHKLPGATRQLVYSYDASPFGFCVTRANAEENAPALFDTRKMDFVFKEQYLEISSKVPEGANVYGLGEVNSTFKRKFASEKDGEEMGTVTTLWCRDTPVPRDRNVYGAHPFYMEMRDGKAHGVLLLNSNGMDILLTPGKITYKVIGGMLPFFHSYTL